MSFQEVCIIVITVLNVKILSFQEVFIIVITVWMFKKFVIPGSMYNCDNSIEC